MKILQVSHNYHIVGGSDAVFFATSEMLQSAGHQVIPFCISNPRNRSTPWSKYFPKCAKTNKFSVRNTKKYFYNSDAKIKLNRLLDFSGPIDVAHLHIYHGKHTPAILSVFRDRGIPVIQTLHEYKLACPTYTMQRDGRPCARCIDGSRLNSIRYKCKDGSIIRSTIMAAEQASSRMLGDVRNIDRFICVSEFQRQVLIKSGLPSSKIFTLHNFVKQAPVLSRGNDGYFLYTGRIERLKGLHTLIRAFENSGKKLLVAGKGSWQNQLIDRIQDHPNINFVGFQSGQELNQLISRACAVIVPSEWNENCPMSVLEAKALGKPVIGANIGGIPELVQDGIDGVLFEPGSVESLNDAIEYIDHSNIGVLSMNALKDANLRFSEKAHLEALHLHYSEIIQASNSKVKTAC